MIRAKASAFAVAALSSLLALGCGWDDEQGSPLLARAVEKTRDAGGARYTSTWFFALVDRSYRLHEQGVVDSRGSTDAAIDVTVHERGSRPQTVETLQRHIGDRSYFRARSDPLWTDIDTSDAEFAISGLASGGPAALDELPYLRDVRRVGSAEARGVGMTHYRAETPLAQLANVAEPGERAAAQRELWRLIRSGATGSGLRTDVWLDGAGRVRRVDERLSLRLPGYDPRPTRSRTGFFDFGPKPLIRVPRS